MYENYVVLVIKNAVCYFYYYDNDNWSIHKKILKCFALPRIQCIFNGTRHYYADWYSTIS